MARDPRVEQWLTREGVEWHQETHVPLSLVDWELSLKNQARLGQALIQEHVDELAVRILDGVELPDPVGYYAGKKLVIISGNHRVAARRHLNELKLGTPVEHLDWYIVETFPWKIDVLTRTANALEGLPLSRNERLEQAKYLVMTLNYSQTEAARALGISESMVNTALLAQDVAERLKRQKYDEKLPVTTLCSLYRIKQDAALLGAAVLVKEAQLGADEAADLARKVSGAASSPKQQTRILADARDSYKDRIARTKRGQLKRQIAPTIKLRRALNAINNTRPESVVPLDPDLGRKTKWAIKKLQQFGGEK